jgi:AraC-like DNA-binding protein
VARLQLASRLLIEGGHVSAVAGAVGYESEAAFSPALKKLVGQAPGTWRRGTVAAEIASPLTHSR